MPTCGFQKSATKSAFCRIAITARSELKEEKINNEISRLLNTYHGSNSLAKILSRPEVAYKDLPDRNETLSDEIIQQVEIAVKYAGYIERQALEVEKFKTLEDKIIPDTFDFSTVPSLRLEARQKLCKIRPRTIGQAARISGVSPADISILLVCLKRWGANGQADSSKDMETNESELPSGWP